MIKALLLIFQPVATWDGIFRAQRRVGFILLFYLLPLLAFTSAGEAYGLHRWGKWQSEVTRPKTYSAPEAAIYEIGQILLSLLIVFLAAKLVKSFGETFHGRHTYAQAFRTVAYGLSPLFLCRLLDAFPSISPWLSWAIGIVLAIGALYHGVPRVMQPDPPSAFGLYLMTSVLLLMITGIARFITAWYLQGRFEGLKAFISSLAARLHF